MSEHNDETNAQDVPRQASEETQTSEGTPASEETQASEAAAPEPSPAEPSPSATDRERLLARKADEEVERKIHAISRRSFLWAGVAVASGFVGWQWLIHQRDADGIPWPFRVALEIDGNLAQDYFKPSRLAPTFARSQAEDPKTNGDLGLSEDFEPSTWKLHVFGIASDAQETAPDNAAAPTDKKSAKKDARDDCCSDSTAPAPPAERPRLFTLADIQRLPRVEMVTQLKCIEGWSVIVQWAGARLADFIAQYPPADANGAPVDVKHHPEALPGYVGLKTPDGGYYVGLDMESALHPQTLLCYEMNGEPLSLEHGAPLRLVTPTKYGIKHIKRIGSLRYAIERPADYWAEQGYDWYAGH